MTALKPLCAVALLAVTLTVNAGPKPSEMARTLTAREFITFSATKQHWYYYGAFDALAHHISLTDAAKGQCIWRWLPEKPKKRKALLLKSFEKHPDHAPTSIILSLMKKHCGLYKTPPTKPN
ncbi:MAG: hypothetical protein HRT35_30445 [Algicola sp.]|nr:hypothetical protein [Algicola sp.]